MNGFAISTLLRLSIAIALLIAPALASAQPSENLLAQARPARSSGVWRADVLTDGKIGDQGSSWKVEHSAVFFDTAASVVFDLGAERTFGAALLQGDANDSYELAVSNDGEHFTSLWTAGPVPAAGLQLRSARDLGGAGRYVRVRPTSGDGHFAISELMLFAAAPVQFPPALPELRGVSADRRLRDKTLLFGLALLIPVLVLRRGSRTGWIVASALVVLLGAWQFVAAWMGAVPVESREVALVRGMVAGVAVIAVLRSFAPPIRFPPHAPAITGVLAVCGALAFAAFYNLGQPQFYSVASGRWTYAHHLDLRQYYPTAKYFRELGYRRLYEADIAAYLEDNSTSIETLKNLPMRDLRSLNETTVGQSVREIAAARARFDEPRWQEYKRDARWFRGAMGQKDYWDSLLDFGGNATPVWIGIAHVLFSLFAPGERAFTLTGALDLALLAGMFVAIFRSFGTRAGLVSLVVFGANDFVMYGTNWSGATLRHDWLAYIGFGVCALRRERWLLGGALLGLSAMIRAFPALCVAGACLPALSALIVQAWRERRQPTWRELVERQPALMRIVLGAALSVAVTFAFSLAVGPFEAWGDWWRKVSQLEADPHPAVVGLRNLIAGWEQQGPTLRARAPLYAALIVFYVGIVLAACRHRRPEQAALIALTLVPVILYPANYYIHFVFLLPLIVAPPPSGVPDEPGAELTRTGVWATLLALCAAQYFTVLVSDLALHFYLASALLFAALTTMLVLLVRNDLVASN